ncbi:MAG: DUF1440 domain-containing protein [Kofleriaceae bacterium]|nr:DUF1440 domain-containing protein [Kofleriaceae bacterium]
MSPFGPQHEPDEGATEALGRIVYERVVGREPSPRTKTVLSWTAHLAVGFATAALYAVIRGGKNKHVLLEGALFGTGLWIVMDELTVPLLGLSDKPTAYPASQHAQALAQHLGFGIATVATTRALEDWR